MYDTHEIWYCCNCGLNGHGALWAAINSHCTSCDHARCIDCTPDYIKIRVGGPNPQRQHTSSPPSASNPRSTIAAGSRAQDIGSGRGEESGSGDEGDQNQQSDVVLESAIDSTHAALLQDARISDSAELSPYLIPPDPDEPKPQEGEVENFDTDQDSLNMVGTTEVNATSSETKENEMEGSGNIGLRRDFLQSQVSSEHALGLFIKDPDSYSREITVLEHSILQLGQNTFEKIKEYDEARRYVLPLRELDIGSDSPTPFTQLLIVLELTNTSNFRFP